MSEAKKDLRPPSEYFERALTTGGSIVMDCDFCGRTHFEDSEGAGDWDDGELEGLRAKAIAQPDKYHGCNYSVCGGDVNGKRFVIDCPCNGVRPFEDFIWSHGEMIARYLHDRSLAEKNAAALAHKLLGEPLKEAFNL